MLRASESPANFECKSPLVEQLRPPLCADRAPPRPPPRRSGPRRRQRSRLPRIGGPPALCADSRVPTSKRVRTRAIANVAKRSSGRRARDDTSWAKAAAAGNLLSRRVEQTTARQRICTLWKSTPAKSPSATVASSREGAAPCRPRTLSAAGRRNCGRQTSRPAGSRSPRQDRRRGPALARRRGRVRPPAAAGSAGGARAARACRLA